MKHSYQQELVQEQHPIQDEPIADETGANAAPEDSDAEDRDAENSDAEDAPAADETSPAEARPAPARRTRRARYKTGVLLLGAGLLTSAAGIALATLGEAARATVRLAPGQLERLGITPFGLLSTGVLILTAGIVLRKLAQAAASVRSVRTRQKRIGRRVRAISEDMSQVHQNMLVQLDRPPASGEELNRVLQALKKQEEKLQSLAKASMTYAKPIVELGSQYKELSEKANGVQEGMEDLSQMLRATGDRMETRSREVLTKVDESLQVLGSELQQSVSRQIEGLGKALEARGSGTAELDKLARQTQAVQESVHGIGQQLQQSVSRQIEALGKALEARGSGAAELDKLLRQTQAVQESVQAISRELPQSVGRQIEGLGKALESRGSGTAELDKLLRQTQAVQESVATLAQQIAQGVSVAATSQGASGGGGAGGGGTGGAPMPTVSADAAARLTSAANAEPAKTGDVNSAIAKLKKLRGR